MKRLSCMEVIAVAMVLVAVGVARPGSAAEESTSTSEAADSTQAAAHVIRTISGTVTAVVPDANTLLVTVPKGEHDELVVGAWVTDHTVIKEGKTKKRLEDLKVGDKVRVTFERVNDGDIAHLIVVQHGR